MPRHRAPAIRLAHLVLLLASLQPPGASAASEWTVAAYRGQGVTQDFRDVPGAALTGDLRYVPSWESGAAIGRRLPDPDWLGWLGRQLDAPVRAHLVATAYVAEGLARNRAVALDWRGSVEPSIGGGASIEIAWSLGAWHASGTPWYNHHGDRTMDGQYHTLVHVVPEMLLRHRALPGWAAGVRVDHQCGLYGAFAPAALGTNHVGLVVAREL